MHRSVFRQSGRTLPRLLLAALLLVPGVTRAQGKVATWKATEVWRVDGGEAGEPFADLRDYVVLKDGSMWTLDFKLQEIRRYSAAGKSLGRIARKGQGPGEIENANGMLIANDGTVWVNDPRNARFSVFAPDGKFVRQHLMPINGFGYRWSGWADRRTNEVVEIRIGRDPRDWRRINMAGKEVGVYAPTSCPDGSPSPGIIKAATEGKGESFRPYPFATGGGTVADGNGSFWCAAPRSKRVALIRAGKNDTIMQLAVEYPYLPVTAAERAAAVDVIEKNNAKYATNDFDKSKIPNTKPGIAALHVDADARLWVQHTGIFGKSGSSFDIFDSKGKQLGHLELPMKQNVMMPIRARGNLLWLTMLDEDDVPYIVHYRLQQ